MAADKVLKDFIEEMKRLVRDTAGKLQEPADYEAALKRALEIYTVDKPGTDGAAHTVDEEESTVYDGDYYAVCKLAAAEALGDLASHYSHTNENTFLTADIASFRTKRQEFQSRADTLRKEYRDHVDRTEVSDDTSTVTGAQRTVAVPVEIVW
jgi:hypothetical protein